METFVLQAESRALTGKKVKQLRRQGLLPAVLYGHKVAPELLAIRRGEMEKVYRQAGGSSVVTVKLGAKQRNVLIHEVQLDPVTGFHIHADLYQVRMDEKIKAQIPLVFEGTSPAVRELDGTFVTNLSEIEVECLPGDLPAELIVSVEGLATFEDALTVADIKVPSGVEVVTDPDISVAIVTPPRTQDELDDLEAEDTLDMDAVESEEGGEEEAAEEKEKPAE